MENICVNKSMKNKLSRILVLIGIIFAGYWIFVNFDYLFNPELYFLSFPKVAFLPISYKFIIYILPILLGLIGIIKSKSKPVMSGILMIAGGGIFFYNFLLYFVPYNCYIADYVFLIPALSLIIGGLLMLIQDKTK